MIRCKNVKLNSLRRVFQSQHSCQYCLVNEIWRGYRLASFFFFLLVCIITAPFNNMRTLKFKLRRKNTFFATVNQMLGGACQLPTTAERAVIKSLSTVQATKQCPVVVEIWEKPPNIWLTVAKKRICQLNFRDRMLLKGDASGIT